MKLDVNIVFNKIDIVQDWINHPTGFITNFELNMRKYLPVE